MRAKRPLSRLHLRVTLQLLLLVLLAALSAYPAPDFTDTNWDIVLFLTPIGILKNLIAANPALRSFYFDISSGQVPMGLPQGVAVFFIVSLLFANGRALLREISGTKS